MNEHEGERAAWETSHVESLPVDATGTCEVSTKNGTRILFDMDDDVFCRLPARHADGRVNVQNLDGEWQRLTWQPRRLHPDGPYATDAQPVVVGERATYGPGLGAHHHAGPVDPPGRVAEAPPPSNPAVSHRPDENPSVAWRCCTLSDLDAEGSGVTSAQAVVRFANRVDVWLDQVARGQAPQTRVALAWAARADATGCVRTWVLTYLGIDPADREGHAAEARGIEDEERRDHHEAPHEEAPDD